MASNPTSIKMHNRVQELTSPSETTLGQNLSVNLSQSLRGSSPVVGVISCTFPSTLSRVEQLAIEFFEILVLSLQDLFLAINLNARQGHITFSNAQNRPFVTDSRFSRLNPIIRRLQTLGAREPSRRRSGCGKGEKGGPVRSVMYKLKFVCGSVA
ncbi:hypothetical protein KCU73_g41, partial [Aureobasidium melanogenum]